MTSEQQALLRAEARRLRELAEAMDAAAANGSAGAASGSVGAASAAEPVGLPATPVPIAPRAARPSDVPNWLAGQTRENAAYHVFLASGKEMKLAELTTAMRAGGKPIASERVLSNVLCQDSRFISDGFGTWQLSDWDKEAKAEKKRWRDDIRARSLASLAQSDGEQREPPHGNISTSG